MRGYACECVHACTAGWGADVLVRCVGFQVAGQQRVLGLIRHRRGYCSLLSLCRTYRIRHGQLLSASWTGLLFQPGGPSPVGQGSGWVAPGCENLIYTFLLLGCFSNFFAYFPSKILGSTKSGGEFPKSGFVCAHQNDGSWEF